MPFKSGYKGLAAHRLLFLILILVLINTIMVFYGAYVIYDQILRSDPLFAYKQELARDIFDYSHRLAANLGVQNDEEVREALAEYNYALDLAVNSEELIQVVLNQGRQLQDVIFQTSDTRLKDSLLETLNGDPAIQQYSGRTRIYVRINDGRVNITPEQFVEANTLQRINNLVLTSSYYGNQTLEIEIGEGIAQLVAPQPPEEQLQALADDLNATRSRLHETRMQAGLEEMIGPGIALYVYDAEEGTGSGAIVHDADVRDLVNELFGSGARGVSVGGQRLTVSSSIRCVGPLIMVNFNQIATNPVVIEAVGDPDLLVSGLAIITREMESRRGLNFEINHSGFIKLPAYSRVE